MQKRSCSLSVLIRSGTLTAAGTTVLLFPFSSHPCFLMCPNTSSTIALQQRASIRATPEPGTALETPLRHFMHLLQRGEDKGVAELVTSPAQKDCSGLSLEWIFQAILPKPLLALESSFECAVLKYNGREKQTRENAVSLTGPLPAPDTCGVVPSPA